MFCQSCGAHVAGAFCTTCGARAGQPSPPSPPPPAYTPPPTTTPVDSQPLAKERLNPLGDAAQQHGKEAAKLARQGIGAMAARMGTVGLCAAVLLWIAWFFFPAASAFPGSAAPITYTFWRLLGIDYGGPGTMLAGTGGHGLFSLLGLVAIAAPFAAPFIRAAWSKYLNAAPLVCFGIAFLATSVNKNKAFQVVTAMGIPNPFSWNWPILLVLGIAALALAKGALKKP
jgi:hypothetical protein